MAALVYTAIVVLELLVVAAEEGRKQCCQCVSIIHALFTECVRSISDFDEDDYDSFATNYSYIHGYYSYMLPCGGIVTSVRARGFCGRPDDVELRLLSFRRNNGYRSLTGPLLVSAHCDKNATADGRYEGYVSNDSLNYRVEPGHILAVFFNQDCEDLKCYFEPAVINKTSNYDVAFANSHIVWKNTNMSLFFFANITGS